MSRPLFAVQETLNALDTKWRMTKFGWLDSTTWDRPEPIAMERRIEKVHPLLFSALLILTSTGLLIWGSEGDWPEWP